MSVSIDGAIFREHKNAADLLIFDAVEHSNAFMLDFVAIVAVSREVVVLRLKMARAAASVFLPASVEAADGAIRSIRRDRVSDPCSPALPGAKSRNLLLQAARGRNGVQFRVPDLRQPSLGRFKVSDLGGTEPGAEDQSKSKHFSHNHLAIY